MSVCVHQVQFKALFSTASSVRGARRDGGERRGPRRRPTDRADRGRRRQKDAGHGGDQVRHRRRNRFLRGRHRRLHLPGQGRQRTDRLPGPHGPRSRHHRRRSDQRQQQNRQIILPMRVGFFFFYERLFIRAPDEA